MILWALVGVAALLFVGIAVGDPVLPYTDLPLQILNLSPLQLEIFLEKNTTINSTSTLYKLLKQWSPTCVKNNTVLARTEKNMLKHHDRLAPWSIAVESVQFQNLDSNKCHSLASLISSVGAGSRDCTLNMASPVEICNIFDKYSNIIWIGDSLTRHMTQGLQMLLRSDFQWGGLPTLDPNARESCQCDGQFSEHSTCRSFDPATALNIMDVKSREEVCSSNTSFNFQYFQSHHFETLAYTCPQGDKRPTFIYTQGGNGASNDYGLMNHWLNPVAAVLKKYASDCPQSTVHVVISGGNVQSRTLDKLYPGQSREQTALFNKHLQEVVHSAGYKWTWLDFFNMTLDVDTSDGYHYLSATNLQKANVVVQLMNLFAYSSP